MGDRHGGRELRRLARPGRHGQPRLPAQRPAAPGGRPVDCVAAGGHLRPRGERVRQLGRPHADGRRRRRGAAARHPRLLRRPHGQYLDRREFRRRGPEVDERRLADAAADRHEGAVRRSADAAPDRALSHLRRARQQHEPHAAERPGRHRRGPRARSRDRPARVGLRGGRLRQPPHGGIRRRGQLPAAVGLGRQRRRAVRRDRRRAPALRGARQRRAGLRLRPRPEPRAGVRPRRQPRADHSHRPARLRRRNPAGHRHRAVARPRAAAHVRRRPGQQPHLDPGARERRHRGQLRPLRPTWPASSPSSTRSWPTRTATCTSPRRPAAGATRSSRESGTDGGNRAAPDDAVGGRQRGAGAGALAQRRRVQPVRGRHGPQSVPHLRRAARQGARAPQPPAGRLGAQPPRRRGRRAAGLPALLQRSAQARPRAPPPEHAAADSLPDHPVPGSAGPHAAAFARQQGVHAQGGRRPGAAHPEDDAHAARRRGGPRRIRPDGDAGQPAAGDGDRRHAGRAGGRPRAVPGMVQPARTHPRADG